MPSGCFHWSLYPLYPKHFLMNRYYVTGQLTSDNHKSYCSLDSLQVNEANSRLTQQYGATFLPKIFSTATIDWDA